MSGGINQAPLSAPRTALLIVDVQNDMIQDEPYRKDAFLEGLRQLLAAARRGRTEVIHIQHDGGKGGELEAGTPGFEVHPAVQPLDDEIAFVKTRNSAFLGTPLQEYLGGKGIGTLILCGMQTEYCIDATCKSALERGYRVIVPKGGTTTYDNGFFTAETLCRYYEEAIWDGRFASVLPVDTVCEMLEGKTTDL